eukprot:621172-Prorocentrum_lima.AAC.1
MMPCSLLVHVKASIHVSFKFARGMQAWRKVLTTIPLQVCSAGWLQGAPHEAWLLRGGSGVHWPCQTEGNLGSLLQGKGDCLAQGAQASTDEGGWSDQAGCACLSRGKGDCDEPGASCLQGKGDCGDHGAKVLPGE